MSPQSMIALHAVEGPSAWSGADMARRDHWKRRLTPPQIAELDAALAAVEARGLGLLDIRREDFPLPALRPLLDEIGEELESGCGVIRLSGLPVERWSEDQAWIVFWGLSRHLGLPVHQNPVGRLIGWVRDESASGASYVGQRNTLASDGGGTLTNQARVSSSGPLRFHTDLCDVVGLLCLRPAAEGGASRIASSQAIFNAMLRQRPDLAAVLSEPLPFCRPEGHADADGNRIYYQPVWGLADGRFASAYSPVRVEMAQDAPGVPRLTALQKEALQMLHRLQDEMSFAMDFAAGDIQFLNSHVTYHGRTAFRDDPAAGGRLLYRLWLATPDRSRPLPPGFAVEWGETAAGALRGGIRRRHLPADLASLVSPAWQAAVARLRGQPDMP
ncbi:MAG: TauD/TfdA family dioxygenase [Alphaproteobacteria bacterium]